MKCKACGVEKAESEFNSYNGILFSECKECKSTKITVKKTRGSGRRKSFPGKRIKYKPDVSILEQQCISCQQVKNISNFHKDYCFTTGYASTCKDCNRKRYRPGSKPNTSRNGLTAKSLKGTAAYNFYKNIASIKTLYKITEQDLQQLLLQQQGCCKICQADFGDHLVSLNGSDEIRQYQIDHDHTTGKVRGLLCKKCNIAIGKYERSKPDNKKVVEYLTREPPNLLNGTRYDISRTLSKASRKHSENMHSIWSRFRITEENLQQLLLDQTGCCFICERDFGTKLNNKHGRQYHIDHDHKSGHVRGLLCGACNTLIGYLETHNISIMDIETYLDKV